MWNPDEGAPLKRCLYALAAVLALTSNGCGIASRSEAAPSPTRSARAGFGSVNETADIPDPCTLLTTDEVNALTGRTVTQMDEDNATSDAPTRYCQWQQDGGQLAVFISRTTADAFRQQASDARPIEGVGDEAFCQAGHLYVRQDTVQLDIYSYGASDDENEETAERIAAALIPRL
jgi:uncharacterized protein DUF3558